MMLSFIFIFCTLQEEQIHENSHDPLLLTKNTSLLQQYHKVCKAMELFKKTGKLQEAHQLFQICSKWYKYYN